MARDEFDRDLEEYLHARRRSGLDLKGLLSRIVPKKKERPQLPEQVEIYEEPKEEPQVKAPFFARFLGKSASKDELVQSQMQAEDAVSDMKEVAKIALGMIRNLPSEQLRSFKQSSDFERLKLILKKHELIKP